MSPSSPPPLPRLSPSSTHLSTSYYGISIKSHGLMGEPGLYETLEKRSDKTHSRMSFSSTKEKAFSSEERQRGLCKEQNQLTALLDRHRTGSRMCVDGCDVFCTPLWVKLYSNADRSSRTSDTSPACDWFCRCHGLLRQ
uniref:Uncharacterized protein n=1 Tax=Knipowitschia caucasica TaxID=637954 RepID=A0AAV2JD17_KNICA